MNMNILYGASIVVVVIVLGGMFLPLTSKSTYRRWYLMCRNELEKLDPENPVP